MLADPCRSQVRSLYEELVKQGRVVDTNELLHHIARDERRAERKSHDNASPPRHRDERAQSSASPRGGGVTPHTAPNATPHSAAARPPSLFSSGTSSFPVLGLHLLGGSLEKGTVAVNMATKDRGFEEWFEEVWTPPLDARRPRPARLAS